MDRVVRSVISLVKFIVICFLCILTSMTFACMSLLLDILLYCLAPITGSTYAFLHRGLYGIGDNLLSNLKEEYGSMIWQIERKDSYIDELLMKVFEDGVLEYDTYKNEDARIHLSEPTFTPGLDFIYYFDGYITGLKTLRRRSECIMVDNTDQMIVVALLRAGPLNFCYFGTAEFYGKTHLFSVVGSLRNVNLCLDFTVDANTGGDGEIERFEIQRMQDIQFKVYGLKGSDDEKWIEHIINCSFHKIFKQEISIFFEVKVSRRTEIILRDYKLPVEEYDSTKDPYSDDYIRPTQWF